MKYPSTIVFRSIALALLCCIALQSNIVGVVGGLYELAVHSNEASITLPMTHCNGECQMKKQLIAHGTNRSASKTVQLPPVFFLFSAPIPTQAELRAPHVACFRQSRLEDTGLPRSGYLSQVFTPPRIA